MPRSCAGSAATSSLRSKFHGRRFYTVNRPYTGSTTTSSLRINFHGRQCRRPFLISLRGKTARQRQRFHNPRSPEACDITLFRKRYPCVACGITLFTKDSLTHTVTLPLFAKCVTASPVTLSPAIPRACISSDFPVFDAKPPCFRAMTLSQLRSSPL